MRACIKKFIAVTVVLLATACSSSPTKVVPTLQVTEAVVDTPTPPATATQAPSKTPSPTTPPTKTNTLVLSTPAATPDPMLSQIEVIGLSWFENYDLLLSFQFPGEVDPQDYWVTLEDKEYSCEVIDNYPDRLYCRGQGAKVLAEAWVRVYPIGSSEAGFEKAVWIPYFDNNYDSYYSTNP